MAIRVTWLDRAADRIEAGLIPLLTRELKSVFPRASSMAVYDSFGGYSQNHKEKVVLGIEVCGKNSYCTHVLKLGIAEKVANDYDGWLKCVVRHNFSSRIMVSLSKKNLPGGRAAIVYENAYRFFGSPEDGEGAQSLETVAFWAIMDNTPAPESVERVIRQIYTEFYRWFYRAAEADAEAAVAFYKGRLRRAQQKWREDPWRVELRRDLLWLLCGHDDVGSFANVAFIDPCDYVGWALLNDRAPQTLVGRSHGDLHARNVLVGVQRREAEYPVVFDYGEMSDRNVLVWDFVKIETELKVRLLSLLYKHEHSRDVLMALSDQRSLVQARTSKSQWPSAQLNPHSLRAHQLEFAFKFEQVLALLTDRIHKLADPEVPEPPGGRNITGDGTLDRALGILLRIRQEAALFLGDGQPQRGQRGSWRDEYYFGLAVYGLSTAKFDYTEAESAFALVSAGVAAAHIEQAGVDIQAAIASENTCSPRTCRHTVCHYPSYHVPLAHAHRLWKGARNKADLAEALGMLKCASGHFGHAVLLLQEYALLLSEARNHVGALKLLEPLDALCRVFRDEETLSRIGRTCKDLGDHALSHHPVAVADLADHPAWQWYDTAFKHYREAFEISNGYYPGINAATLGLICGFREESVRLAEKALAVCRGQDASLLRRDDRFWLLVTQGEALLLLSNGAEAARFYRQALGMLPAENRGMAQSAYNQVCRLSWALGGLADECREVFRKSRFRVRPGPLENGWTAGHSRAAGG